MGTTMLQPNDYLRPTGSIVIGSVHDCNRAALERSLKFYDPQLYIKWNPKKRGGWGCWEIRRKPEHLTKVYQGQWNGQALYTLEYKENDLVHHVLDVPVLRYDVLGKLKSMDAWNNKNFLNDLDYEAERLKEREEAKAKAELRYNIKQFKREWRDFASLVREGVNPSQIIKGTRG
jgi:hypothetical protein